MGLSLDSRTAAEAPAIRVAGLSKRFRKYTTRGGYTTLKSSLTSRFFTRRFPAGNFVQVLDGVDLSVERGTTLGVIGRNGSGKSTLLKILAGIIRPDAGEVRVRGKISPLIELGAGFHPEFSGRENVYLNGLVLGMTKEETRQRFDAIVGFAGLEDSIDDPVRTYSSGMYMRLAFAVAIQADPDVLLIDEILAVGDEAFIAKCHERIGAFQAAGKTIVMVSHDLDAIKRWCHEAIWLDQGRIAAQGSSYGVVQRYHAAQAPPPAGDGGRATEPDAPSLDSQVPGRLAAEIRVLEPPRVEPEPWHVLFRAMVEIENRGDTLWRALPPTRRGMVMVGGRLHRDGRFLEDIQRALIPRDVYPGERVCVELKFKVPGAGRYRVDLDMVNEGFGWFSELGTSPALALEVEA